MGCVGANEEMFEEEVAAEIRATNGTRNLATSNLQRPVERRHVAFELTED